MDNTTTTTATANPACHACHGTGHDDTFGIDCTECWVDARRTEMVAARYAGVATTAADRQHTPGERLDGRTYGGSTAPSDKQLAYAQQLLADRQTVATLEGATDFQQETLRMAEHLLQSGDKGLTRKACSELIDALKRIPVRSGPRKNTLDAPAQPGRPNRYPGTCTACGTEVAPGEGTIAKGDRGWLTTHTACPEAPAAPAAPANTYDPQRGDVHVIDGTYYRVHIAQRSGRPYAVRCDLISEATYAADGSLEQPGEIDWNYEAAKGMLRQMSDATKATAEQAATLGRLAGRCIYCSHAIDTPESTAAGYGPTCASKYGLPWG